MSMTKEEKFAKEWLRKKLSEEGYPTYAKLLSYFDLNLTNSSRVVAFLEPSKGRIVINRGLDEDQISVVIRHEILHNYLQHEDRLLRKLANEAGVDYDTLSSDMEMDELAKLKNELYKNKDFNRAGDYEISNLGYTDKDKETVRQISLNGELLCGLVTEDDHPDWVDLSVEEMYDKLRKQRDEKAKEPPKYFGYIVDPTTFASIDGVAYGI